MNTRKRTYRIIFVFGVLFLILGICLICIYRIKDYYPDELGNEFFNSFCENESVIKDFESKADYAREYDDKYIVTLNRYIYDGISAYAVFSIKSKDNTKQDLDKFGLSISDELETYYFGNTKWNNLNEAETINANEKMIFLNSIAENNNLYLVDNMDNSEQLRFPLEISTDYFEAKEENFMVRVSPIQVFYMNKKKNAINDISVVYEDGCKIELLKNYNIIGDFLGDSETRSNEAGVVKYYFIRKDIDFDKIKEIEVKLSTGKTTVLKRVSKEQAKLVQ